MLLHFNARSDLYRVHPCPCVRPLNRLFFYCLWGICGFDKHVSRCIQKTENGHRRFHIQINVKLRNVVLHQQRQKFKVKIMNNAFLNGEICRRETCKLETLLKLVITSDTFSVRNVKSRCRWNLNQAILDFQFQCSVFIKEHGGWTKRKKDLIHTFRI